MNKEDRLLFKGTPVEEIKMVVGLIMSVMFTLFGILLRKIHLIEAKADNKELAMQKELKELEKRLIMAVSKDEVREVISDKLEPTQVAHKDLKEDIKQLDMKLDKLINNILSSRQ